MLLIAIMVKKQSNSSDTKEPLFWPATLNDKDGQLLAGGEKS